VSAFKVDARLGDTDARAELALEPEAPGSYYAWVLDLPDGYQRPGAQFSFVRGGTYYGYTVSEATKPDTFFEGTGYPARRADGAVLCQVTAVASERLMNELAAVLAKKPA
jgi:hypothetical protein